MEIILAADASEHGWALIREMHNQPETVDPQLQGMLMKAAKALKKRSKENRGWQPFRGGRGSSAAAKAAAAFLHLQLPLGGIGQAVGTGRQQHIRYSDGDPPSAYTSVYPHYQGAGPHCFICQQPGHFQKACPLGSAAKQEPRSR